jgi:RNA polymerase sporulation-specific sigma factor
VYHDGGDPIYVMDQVRDEKGEDTTWEQDITISEAMGKLTERERQ